MTFGYVIAELDAFLKDTSPDAYEKAVDRLLASPRYPACRRSLAMTFIGHLIQPCCAGDR